MMEVAVIVVPKAHARQLQHDLICALDPTDNRLICDPDYRPDNADSVDINGNTKLPRGYYYDILEIIQAISGEASTDVPF